MWGRLRAALSAYVVSGFSRTTAVVSGFSRTFSEMHTGRRFQFLFILVLTCATPSCFLDLGSQQAVETAHASLRRGMTLREVVQVVEAAADEVGAWSARLTTCGEPSSAFEVRYSRGDSRYTIEESYQIAPYRWELRLTRFAANEDLLRLLDTTPLRGCRSARTTFGRRWIDIGFDRLGKVDEISFPRAAEP
jgi:hypothetical protein